MVDISSLPQEDLEPVPYDVLEAAGVYAEDRPGRRPNRLDAEESGQGPGGGDGGGGVPSPSPDPARSLLAAASPGTKFRVLFLGPLVKAMSVAWAKRLAAEIGAELHCTLLDPPFANEDDLECRGYWLRPVARKPEERVRLLRKHAFTGLVALLSGIVMGYGQGGLVVGLAAVPLVLE